MKGLVILEALAALPVRGERLVWRGREDVVYFVNCNLGRRFRVQRAQLVVVRVEAAVIGVVVDDSRRLSGRITTRHLAGHDVCVFALRRLQLHALL